MVHGRSAARLRFPVAFRGGSTMLAMAVVLAIQATVLGPALAQEETSPSRDTAARDAESRLTPRETVVGYLEACRRGDYESAAHHLDLAGIEDPERGRELARKLKIVLDKKLWVEVDQLSSEPGGHSDDGLPPRYDRVGTLKTSRGPVDVLVERVSRADGEIWLLSGSTVDRIPRLYAEFGYGALGEFLPEPFFEWRFLEVQLWQWIGLFLLVFLVYVLSWIVSAGLIRSVRPLVARSETEIDDQLLGAAAVPLRLAVAVGLFALSKPALGLAVVARDFLGGVEKTIGVIAITMLVLRLVDIVSAVGEKKLGDKGMASVHAILPLGRRAVKAVLIILAVIALLQNLGVNVSGLVAGLGIGGLAFALAAQKTIENLFGGATIIADQPVRVGDFCRFGDKIGTIEDIGLRSTRVRTLDRTIVTVPNAEFSAMQLENFAKRDRIRLHFNIGVRYETGADQLRYLLVELKRMLVGHPKILPEPARVRFINFGAHSLDLEVFCYIDTRDWNEFLAIREDVYLRIMDVVEKTGTGFAFPSQTLYLGRDGGLDQDAASRAEKSVQDWRASRKLPLPDPTPEMLAALEDSLDYPPEGSVAVAAPPDA